MQDKMGRNISYIRVSVTDRCNLRCRYCMPEQGIEKKNHDEMLTLEEIYEVIAACSELGISKVRITGGEPLVRKGVPSLIGRISALPGINEVVLTTNGLLLRDYSQELKQAGLRRVNISLDTLDPEKYRNITRGGDINAVFAGIKAAREAGLNPIKLNTVLIGGFNDNEIESFVNMTLDNDMDVRFIELMPMGLAASWTKEHFIPNTTVLERVKTLQPDKEIEAGSPAQYYRLPGAKGRVGLINPISHMFCGDCNRIRLTADGKVKPCLHSNLEYDVRDVLRVTSEGNKIEKIKHAVADAVNAKPEKHGLNEAGSQPVLRDMFQIGG